jgi:hypothetical protein
VKSNEMLNDLTIRHARVETTSSLTANWFTPAPHRLDDTAPSATRSVHVRVMVFSMRPADVICQQGPDEREKTGKHISSGANLDTAPKLSLSDVADRIVVARQLWED